MTDERMRKFAEVVTTCGEVVTYVPVRKNQASVKCKHCFPEETETAVLSAVEGSK